MDPGEPGAFGGCGGAEAGAESEGVGSDLGGERPRVVAGASRCAFGGCSGAVGGWGPAGWFGSPLVRAPEAGVEVRSVRWGVPGTDRVGVARPPRYERH